MFKMDAFFFFCFGFHENTGRGIPLLGLGVVFHNRNDFWWAGRLQITMIASLKAAVVWLLDQSVLKVLSRLLWSQLSVRNVMKNCTPSWINFSGILHCLTPAYWHAIKMWISTVFCFKRNIFSHIILPVTPLYLWPW